MSGIDEQRFGERIMNRKTSRLKSSIDVFRGEPTNKGAAWRVFCYSRGETGLTF